MIPLVTRREARAMDAAAVATGTPSLALMERAGAGAAAVLRARFPSHYAVIVGGVGQNGGDAWVVARLLLDGGARPDVLLLGDEAAVSGDALSNLRLLAERGVRPLAASASALSSALAKPGAVIVDGVFGTGLSRAVEGEAAALFAQLNAAGLPVLALDVPSGVDADTGAVLGAALRATVTVTFGAEKRGLHQHPGAALAGEVVCVDIGAPPPAEPSAARLTAVDVVRALPERRGDTHKHAAGHVAVVGGHAGTTGAAVLAGLGAVRAGAGLATLFMRAAPLGAPPEFMVHVLAGTSLEEPRALAEQVTRTAPVLVVGPGLGRDAWTRAFLEALGEHPTARVVVDADALRVLADAPRLLAGLGARAVLTPHPGEAAALLGVTPGEVQADRYAAAERLAERTGAVVVLKGAGTLVAAPAAPGKVGGPGGGHDPLWVASGAEPALATAGAGDVLAGAVAGVWAGLGAGAPGKLAAAVAVFLHAEAARLARQADRGLLASEVADALPRALTGLREQAHAAR